MPDFATQPLSDALVLTDDQQQIIWVSPEFEKITGYCLMDIIGKNFPHLLNGPLTDTRIQDEIEETLNCLVPFKTLIWHYRRNGETYLSEMFVQPILNAEGKPVHFLFVENDKRHKKKPMEDNENFRQSVWKEVEEIMAAAQKKERQQLAQELHDNVNQVLTTVKLHMEMVLDDKVDKKEILPRTMGNIQFCIDELRTISRRLSTQELQQQVNLGAQLSELAEAVNVTEKINLSYSVEKVAFERMPYQVQNAIWKTIQEQVNNILKHSKADLAHIRLWKQNDWVYLQVKDYGIGFEATKKNEGIGLQNMRNRAEDLNGTFSLKTAPGKGCEVQLAIPFK